MESNKSSCRISGIYKSSSRKLRVRRINIVSHNVIKWSSNHSIFRNLRRDKHDICTHEIADVINSECSLHSNLSSAQVFIYIQCIYPNRNSCGSSSHSLKFIFYSSDSHRKSHLPRCLMTGQGSHFQHVVKFCHDHILKVSRKFLVCHCNRSFIALFCDSFNRYAFFVFLDFDGIEVFFRHFVLRQRYDITFCYIPRLQHTRGFSNSQYRSIFLPDHSCNSHYIQKSLHILSERSNKVNFSRPYLNLCNTCHVFRSCKNLQT